MKLLIVIFILSACSSSSKNENGSEQLTNADFKKQEQVRYTKDQEQFSSNKGPLNFVSVFGNESVELMNESERDDVVDQGNPLTQSLMRCHKGEIQKALIDLVEIGKVYQKHPVYWNSIGICYLLNKENDKAQMFFNKALDVFPEYTPALNNLGVMLVREGSAQKAMIAFERAVKSAAFSLLPKYNLAVLHLRYYQVNQALQYLIPLYKNYPNEQGVIYSLAFAKLLQGEYAQSSGLFKQLNKEFLRKTEVAINYAIAVALSGDKKAAKEIYEDLDIEKSPALRAQYQKLGTLL